MVAGLLVAAASALAASAWPVYRAPGGVVISYPAAWQVAVSRTGLIGIAGPRAAWGRPVALVSVLRGGGTPQATVDRAARLMGDPAPLRLLGAQRLGPGRLAKYYLRAARSSDSGTAYVMVGSAEGKTAAVVIVGVDSVRDPNLRVRAGIFQALLLRVTVP